MLQGSVALHLNAQAAPEGAAGAVSYHEVGCLYCVVLSLQSSSSVMLISLSMLMPQLSAFLDRVAIVLSGEAMTFRRKEIALHLKAQTVPEVAAVAIGNQEAGCLDHAALVLQGSNGAHSHELENVMPQLSVFLRRVAHQDSDVQKLENAHHTLFGQPGLQSQTLAGQQEVRFKVSCNLTVHCTVCLDCGVRWAHRSAWGSAYHYSLLPSCASHQCQMLPASILLAQAALIFFAGKEYAGRRCSTHLHFRTEKMDSNALRWLHTSIYDGHLVVTSGSSHAHLCSGHAAGDALLTLLHTLNCMAQADAAGLICAQRPLQQQGQQLVLGEVSHALRA